MGKESALLGVFSPDPPVQKPVLAYNTDTCIPQDLSVFRKRQNTDFPHLPITHALELSSDAPRDCVGLLELAVVHHVSGCVGLGGRAWRS
jgi:hypothetical protein